jgi:hypothetical protein
MRLPSAMIFRASAAVTGDESCTLDKGMAAAMMSKKTMRIPEN